ncbi:MAG: MFS transporter, partial [Flavisolibacter sp.]
ATTSILPSITVQFHSDPQMGKWIATAYVLVICALLLPAGRLGDQWGHRRLYLTGLGITLGGSLCCTLASSIQVLIGCRGLEAIGIASMMANGTALLMQYGSDKKRGWLLGILSAFAYMGLIAGTALSGLLYHHFGLPVIYMIIAFLASVSTLFCLLFVPADPAGTPRALVLPHLVGTLVWIIGPGLMVLAFQWSVPSEWWLMGRAGLLILGFNLLFSQVGRTKNWKSGITLDRSVLFALGTSLLVYVSLYAITFILPFCFSAIRDLTLARAGIILGIRPLVTVLFAPVGGSFTDRFGARWISLLGLLIWFGLLVFIVHEKLSVVLPFIILSGGMGLGMGFFLPSNHSIIMTEAPVGQKGTISALLPLARNVGMLIGFSLGGSLLRSDPHKLFPPVLQAAGLMISIALILTLVAGLSCFGKRSNLSKPDSKTNHGYLIFRRSRP